MREEGVVTHYNNQKGFGFIKAPEGPDIWFHISYVDEGSSVMVTGVLVEYELGTEDKRRVAKNISIIGGK